MPAEPHVFDKSFDGHMISAKVCDQVYATIIKQQHLTLNVQSRTCCCGVTAALAEFRRSSAHTPLIAMLLFKSLFIHQHELLTAAVPDWDLNKILPEQEGSEATGL